MRPLHTIGIEQVAATVTGLLGVPTHPGAASPIDPVLTGAARAFGGKPCDRVFLYNPDAIAAWIYDRYKPDFAAMEAASHLKLAMRSVMPTVTPVCFASMYSGVTPDVHGIQGYVKPVLTVDTVFDDLIRAGKKAAIVSTAGDSISLIFLQRKMDYFIYPTKEECNAKALELIEEDRHDLIVLYNGDYDGQMHRYTPEGAPALQALRENIATHENLRSAITRRWQGHRTLLAFAPDHGCHTDEAGNGTHGSDRACDRHIFHFYSFIKE